MRVNALRKLVLNDMRNFGLVRTVYDITFRAINQIAYFKILKGMKIDLVNPRFIEVDNRYCCCFLTADLLRDYSKQPEYEIAPEFLEQALSKGDQCFGIVDGDKLASYGWYSNKATIITDELSLHFNPQFIYMYKGFTHNDYRGQRLHAIGMNLALRAYLQQGFQGLVSYVESNNFSSLKSVYRMGYKDFGEIFIMKAADKYLIFPSPGCKQYGFEVKLTPSLEERRKAEDGSREKEKTAEYYS